MAKTKVKPRKGKETPKKGNRVPLLCPRCPKVVGQLTQHLRDKHGLRPDAAKNERDVAYRKMLRNIRNFSVLNEEDVKDMMKEEKIDLKGIKGLLEQCGHLVVVKGSEKRKKHVKEDGQLDLFVQFPCSPQNSLPSKMALESAFGSQADTKALASQWLYKQQRCRAEALVDFFSRKRPTDKQIEQHFAKKGWSLGKTQLQVLQKALDKKWSNVEVFRKVPTNDNSLAELIDKVAWDGIAAVSNLEDRGKGVFTTRNYMKGEVVCDYQGVVTEGLTATEVEAYIENKSSSIYIMQVMHDSKYTVIDATEDDGLFGRLINHSSRHDNLKPERRILQGKLHIVLVAKSDILAGKEVLFNYGDKSSMLPDCVPGCMYCVLEENYTAPEKKNRHLTAPQQLQRRLLSS